jgi:hypothetical protein
MWQGRLLSSVITSNSDVTSINMEEMASCVLHAIFHSSGKRKFVPHYLIILSFTFLTTKKSILNIRQLKRLDMLSTSLRMRSKSRLTSEALLWTEAAATVCIHLVAHCGNVAGSICVTLGLQSNQLSFHFLPSGHRTWVIHAKFTDRCLLDNKFIAPTYVMRAGVAQSV